MKDHNASINLLPVKRVFYRKIMCFGVSLVCILLLASCSSKNELSPEQQIEQRLNMAVEYIESADWDKLSDMIADNYQDDAGRSNKDLARLAFVVFRRGPIKLTLLGTQVTVAGETATVTTKAYAIQGREASNLPVDLIPERGRAFNLTILYRWSGSEWLVERIDGAFA